eukprot:Phypoly_transcript_01038.p1 GENE.Phypoly_transcript_01038~~Phypoly_transcript_01038.p1  ORF type:complete len:1240 (+),score=185.34 Phypoly_transcript_01038:28-3720(+)
MNVHQGVLVKQLEHIFPNEKPYVNARKQANIKYSPNETFYLELDVWFPKRNICFEFQDEYHYSTTWYFHKSTDAIQLKDRSKKENVQQAGIQVIVIPCWWDGTTESLASTIAFYCPEAGPAIPVLPPISLNPPLDFFQVREIPDVGELMSVSFPVDSKFIFQNQWWLGEKYDGIRVCWNPFQRSVYTRLGNQLPILSQITGMLSPSIIIDAELWFGRGLFSQSLTLVSQSPVAVAWQVLRMIAFDAPPKNDDHVPFEVRYYFLLANTSFGNPFVVIAPRFLWNRNIPLNSAVQLIIDHGGEGLILRKFGSLYLHGRSQSLLKLKASYGDMEGIVVGKDKLEVRLQLPNGAEFGVPLESVFVPKLAIGDIVTFSYESQIKKYIPVEPKIFRVRTDLSWSSVVHFFGSSDRSLNGASTVRGITTDTISYWSTKSMRQFLETFAKKYKLDPLHPSTWNKLKHEVLLDKKGKLLVLKFNDYVNAIQFLFPEIKFEGNSSLAPLWHNVENRRSFFEKYARKKRFDPLNPENWYLQSERKLFSVKGTKQILKYHGGSISQALSDLFPEIGLEPVSSQDWSEIAKRNVASLRGTTQMVKPPETPAIIPLKDLDWSNSANRRAFFEDYAKTNDFDPLNAENWYMQTERKIMAVPGINHVIKHHSGSITQALAELFPEIGIEPMSQEEWSEVLKKNVASFRGTTQAITIPAAPGNESRPKGYTAWNYPRYRRRFFENYAKKKGFDPLKPNNWNNQLKRDIMAVKGASQIIQYHENSIVQALCDLFPEIGLKKIAKKSSTRWTLPQSRRKFFEKYAKERGFDPLQADNWYLQSKSNILATEDAKQVIAHHNNNYKQALADLFPEIDLQPELWNTWHKPEYRRSFLEKFAREHGFDPLRASEWYSQSSSQILSSKAMSQMLIYHEDNIAKALFELFPEIGFPPSFPEYNLDVQRRVFFEKYAKENGFNVLDAEKWYLHSRSKIGSVKDLRQVLFFHKNSISRALVDLFPDIAFDKSKFLSSPWSNPDNRRNFFERYASENNFDPLVPLNWYLQSKRNILAAKGATQVLSFHGKNIAKALSDLFPEMSLSPKKFNASSIWQEPSNRKAFFLNYAKAHNFDPLLPENWYQQLKAHIMSEKGAYAVSCYHNNSISKALVDLFPSLDFDRSQLWSPWQEASNRRFFFENYALQNGFDPLVPKNWYLQSREKIRAAKGARQVLYYHNNNISHALVSLFPELRFTQL